MICKKLTNTTNKLGRVWTFGLWTCFVLWMRGSRFTSLLLFQLFCGCGFPLHCFSVYLEFGITESLESNAALVVMNQFCGSVVFTLAWRCVPHSVPFFAMFCPYCKEVQCKKLWTPSQWAACEPTLGNADGCKRCNVMQEADQLRLMESIEWRMWYIAEPAFQSNFNALAKQVHEMPPADKERLHDGYHINSAQPQCGEKITGRIFMITAPGFCNELHVSNLNTAAKLLEQTQQHAFEVNHLCYQQIRDIMELTHYLELYRTIPIPAGLGPFFDVWRRYTQ